MARRADPWFRIGVNAWLLGMEASSVIALRTMKLAAGGGAADEESRRMVTEKIDTGLALGSMAMTGALGLSAQAIAARTISHYRKKVRANRRRLARR